MSHAAHSAVMEGVRNTDTCEEIRCKLFSSVENPSEQDRSFIPRQALHSIWLSPAFSDNRLDRFLEAQGWQVDDNQKAWIRDNSLMIMSILILCHWTDWQAFAQKFRIFDEGSQLRTDQHLPFSADTIKDLFPSPFVRRRFYQDQQLFLAVVLNHNERCQLDSTHRLPFTNFRPRTAKGGYAAIYNATVAAHHYIGAGEQEPSHAPKNVVVKCISHKDIFDQEAKFLENIRNTDMSSHNIMCNLGTIEMTGKDNENRFYILYEPADMDLEDFLKGPRHWQNLDPGLASCGLSELDAKSIMWQADHLITAFSHVHHGIRLDGRRQIKCAHHDIKTDNILVKFDRLKGRLKLMISDFGIARMEQASLVISGEDETDAFSSTPSDLNWRSEGKFTGPDRPRIRRDAIDVDFAQNCDIFSLGCTLCCVLAYACAGKSCSRNCRICNETARAEDVHRRQNLCGPRIVASLEKALNKEGNDHWFHSHIYRAVKKSLLHWLTALQNSCEEPRDTWIVSTIDLICSMLQERQNRPTTTEVQKEMGKIAASMDCSSPSRSSGKDKAKPRLESPNLKKLITRSTATATSNRIRTKPSPLDVDALQESSDVNRRALCSFDTRNPQEEGSAHSFLQPSQQSCGCSDSHAFGLLENPRGLLTPPKTGDLSHQSFPSLSSSPGLTDSSERPLFLPVRDSNQTSPRFQKYYNPFNSEVQTTLSPCGKFMLIYSKQGCTVHKLQSSSREIVLSVENCKVRGNEVSPIKAGKGWTVKNACLNHPWLVIHRQADKTRRHEVQLFLIRDDGQISNKSTSYSLDLDGLFHVQVCTTGLILLLFWGRIDVGRVRETGNSLSIERITTFSAEPNSTFCGFAHSRDGSCVYVWERQKALELWHAWQIDPVSKMWEPTPRSSLDDADKKDSLGHRLIPLSASVVAIQTNSVDLKHGHNESKNRKSLTGFAQVVGAAITPDETALILVTCDSQKHAIISFSIKRPWSSEPTLEDPVTIQVEHKPKKRYISRSIRCQSVGLALVAAEEPLTDSRTPIYAIVSYPNSGLVQKQLIGYNKVS